MNALERGLAVLETLSQGKMDMGISELARITKTDKSTVFRLVASLVSTGYAVQDAETKKYRATSKLVVLGSAVLARIDLRQTAHPFLTRLVERTGHVSLLGALPEGQWRQVVYFDQAMPSLTAFMVNIRVGRLVPSHCTATGKAILAFLSQEQRAQLEGELPRHTAKTLASGAALRLHLEAVRALGYAVDDEEFQEGLRCIAAPVWNHAGAVVASLGVSAPATEMRLEEVPRLARLVMEQANGVSRALGYAPGDARAAASVAALAL